jgi:hypothetical protein
MGKLRRGGFVFVWWKGDHPPRHVHVYRDGKLVVKWDLDNKKAMRGHASRRVIDLIEILESEGML